MAFRSVRNLLGLATSVNALRIYRNTLVLATSMHAFATYIGFPISAQGPSMLPTLAVSGDFIWISTRYRRGRGIQVGDVVSFRHPWDPQASAGKRVLGMPGDYILRDGPQQQEDRNHDTTLMEIHEPNKQMMVLVPEGHCWLAGDNTPCSRDSRDYGPLPLALLRGKMVARIWPLERIGWVQNRLHAL